MIAIRAEPPAVRGDGATARRARRTPRRDPRRRLREPTLLVVGDSQRRDQVAASLSPLGLRVRVADSLPDAFAGAELDAIGVTLVAPLPRLANPAAVAALRADSRTERLPIFVVLQDDAAGTRAVRRLYAEGATAVLEWPREALLMPRVIRELLAVTSRPQSLRPIDRALARSVSARLRLVEGVGKNVKVGAADGVLHLRGRVASLHLKQTLLAFASQVPGVISIVADALVVRDSGTTDRRLARQVRELLRGVVEGDTLSLTVNDGHVVLMGSVADHASFEELVTLLSSVRGVRAITNQTRESAARRRRDHRVAAGLQRAIERQHPDARVRVAVLGDVAVLSGEVDLLATRTAIERRVRSAREIERVVDKVEVARARDGGDRGGSRGRQAGPDPKEGT